MRSIEQELKDSYEERKSRNSAYSLRAFARYLEIDATDLSKVLNGKKKPGKKLSTRLLDKLGTSPEDQDVIISNSVSLSKLKPSTDKDFTQLSNDQFKFMSKWQYFAILELLETKDVIHETSWIAKRLGISEIEARISLERMVRLEVLDFTDGKWIERGSGKMTDASPSVSSSARVLSQTQVLEKSLSALESVSKDLRDHSSMTCSINTDSIPHVKELIKEFRRKISKYLNKNQNKDEVYQLAISFYPLTKTREEL